MKIKNNTMIPVVDDFSKSHPSIFIHNNNSVTLVKPKDHYDSKTGEAENVYGNFLKITCDFGYYLLLVPFRFKLNEEKTEWIIHKNVFQQILCSISHILLLYEYFTEIRKYPFENLNKKDPTEYFKWFQRVCSFIYHAFMILVFWRDKSKFCSIINYLSQAIHLASNSTKIQSKYAISFTCLFYVIVSVLCQGFGHGVISSPSDWKNPSWFYRRYVQAARYNFFLTSQYNYTLPPELELEQITTIHVFLTLITFTGYYFRNLFAYYSDGFVLMACLTLWVPTRGFSTLIRSEIVKIREEPQQILQSNSPQFNNILDSYYSLKQLSTLLNDAMGFIMLTFMLEAITYFSTHLNALFIATDWLKRLRAGTLFVNSIAIFFVSGDICKQVEEMQEWLSLKEVGDKINQNRLVVLLNEVKHHFIGISGNIFILDYSAIFNIISTMVTFFIICSQGESE